MTTQETGGQPAPESVVEAYEETISGFGQIDRWIMSQRWRDGRFSRSVVCDPRPGKVVSESVKRNGGLLVLEGCPDAIREHIIRLHNKWLANRNLTI